MIYVCKHNFLLIAVLFIFMPIFAYPSQPIDPLTGNKNEENTISWNKYYSLKPTDFQGKKKRNYHGTAAITASSFGFSIVNENGNISGNIFVQFYRDDSWWNPDNNESKRKNEILKHEQVHFDITELFGRKLFKEILKLKKSGRLNNKSIGKLYSRLEKEYRKYQDDYDADTRHSLNYDQQQKWNRRIKNELETLDAYSNYHSF